MDAEDRPSLPAAAGAFPARPVFPNPDPSNAELALSAIPPAPQERQELTDLWGPEGLLFRPGDATRDPAPRMPAASPAAAPMDAMPMAAPLPRAQAPAFEARAGAELDERSPARFDGLAGPAYYGSGTKGGGPGPGDPERAVPAAPFAPAGELDLNGLLQYFPFLFTAFCMCVWIVPVWVMYHVGQDVNITHWITDLLQYTPLLLALYAPVHLIHTINGGPARLPMIVSTVGSSVVLVILGNWIGIDAQRLGNIFAADDCTSFTGKRLLEDQWQQARSFYSDCVDKLSVEQDITFEAAVSQYRITDCPNYSAEVGNAHPDWKYLGELENLYHCSGWCSEEQSMWTGEPTQDSCSVAVALVLNTKIRWSLTQVTFYNITMLCVVSIFLVLATPAMERSEKERLAAGR